MKRNEGFTLLEMILVLSVIAVIVLVTIPNIVQKREIINSVGCDALLEVVNGQILMYELQNGEEPSSIDDLVNDEYITEAQTVCPNGNSITIFDGEASEE